MMQHRAGRLGGITFAPLFAREKVTELRLFDVVHEQANETTMTERTFILSAND